MAKRCAVARVGAMFVALTACAGDFASAGSGAATVEVSRAGQSLRAQRVTVTFSTRRANYASGGFLDLKVDAVPCPLLLTGDQQIVAGRVCTIAGGAWTIAGGSVSGSSLVLQATRYENPPQPMVDALRLAYPEVVDAGADGSVDGSLDDVSGADIVAQDVVFADRAADAPSSLLNCTTLCQQYAFSCGTSYRVACETECGQWIASTANRCTPSFYSFQQCASARPPTTCTAPYLAGFPACTTEYNALLTCARGF